MPAMSDDLGTIHTRNEDGVLVMTIDRTAKRNGFTPKMAGELAAAFTQLESEPALRVGLLCAAGGHFTGGIDLPLWADAM